MTVKSPDRSEAAKEASRANGRRSRGPRSYIGRQISARNAFRHGLRGRQSPEPSFLPPWLKDFDRWIVRTFDYFSQRRRELLDRALVNMLLIEQADRLIAAELNRLGWLLADQPEGAGQSEQAADLVTLERLLTYRRRFSATRDRAISGIVIDGELPPLHAKIKHRLEKRKLKQIKKRRRLVEEVNDELDPMPFIGSSKPGKV